ncbi:hypothetical protein ACFOSD_08355 [Salinispirillum marinum]|uniref:DUF3108 domain-containing protein n=2 Tax=Saccharospirillaceae TaxID=255527 RepID=A0ABV8BDW1_9GAMM
MKRVIYYSIGLLLLLSGQAVSSTWDLMGTARDPVTGDFIYREFHRVELNADQSQTRVVEYRDQNNEVLVVKTLVSPTDRPYLPEIRWDDMAQSSLIEGRFDGGIYEQSIARPNGNDVQRARLDDVQNTVLDAGFDRYLQDRMPDILAQGSLSFDFLSLGAGRTYAITANLIEANDAQIRLNIAPSSALIRWFVDPIELVYDRESLALIRYTGITNFRREGSVVNAVIDYQYSPEAIEDAS